jgi:poly(ADP-ribose) glycohydrolase
MSSPSNATLQQVKLPHHLSNWNKIVQILTQVANPSNSSSANPATNSTEISSISSNDENNSTVPISTGSSFITLIKCIANPEEIGLSGKSFISFIDKYEQKMLFFNEILPFIAELALKLPEQFPKSFNFPYLPRQAPGTINLTAYQCQILLAAGFLCLIPQPPNVDTYPHPNFDILFSQSRPPQAAKYQFFINYFHRCLLDHNDFHKNISSNNNNNNGNNSNNYDKNVRSFTIHRRVLDLSERKSVQSSSLSCQYSSSSLCPFFLKHSGTIEDDSAALQADFANRFIGGGVLETGCVQEEIRFAIAPECITSMLCCEAMESNEAIILIGSEQFSEYKGYGAGLQFGGNFIDRAPLDSQNRRRTALTAIDALVCWQVPQWTEEAISREILKAYAGFSVENNELGGQFDTVATGNWGCGAFAGSVPLKAMIQWIALSLFNAKHNNDQLKRRIHYYTFGDAKCNGLDELVQLLVKQQVTISRLYKALLEFISDKSIDPLQGKGKSSSTDSALYEFLMKKFK